MQKYGTQTVLPPLAPARSRGAALSLRARLAMASVLGAGLAAASTAGAEGLQFDVSSVQTSVMTILGVGVAIAIAFAIYRVGKRGTNKI